MSNARRIGAPSMTEPTGWSSPFDGAASTGERAAARVPAQSVRPADAAMERYATGDDAAFVEVYDHVAPRLRAFILRQTRDAHRTDDVVQQTLLSIHRARASYLRGAGVIPWAFAIARRLLIDASRRGRHEVLQEDDASVVEACSLELGPDELVQTKQAAERLRGVLASLPESQRIAFELLKYDGLTLVEAAEVLGTTVTAVKLRAHKAYVALRAAICDTE